MSLVSSNKNETNTVELVIKVDGETFAAEMQKAYKKGVKNMNVPGFRKGKAPRAIIEKLYGKTVFVEDAVNASYPKAYTDAVDEAKIDPVDVANINVTEADETGYTFTATVTVKPEVTVKDYKGIKAEKEVKTVTAAVLSDEIGKMAERNARFVEVDDRAAENGDMVTLDYSGSVDGVKFDGGTAEKQTLNLGSGQFIPGFEEQVIGHAIGEAFDITVQFPEDYPTQELSGKEAVFAIKLHEIKKKELPEIDDEFAKDVSEFDTLDELKKDLTDKLQKQFDEAAESSVENKILDAVVQSMEAEIPQCMIDHAIDDQIKELEYRLQSQGMTLDMYMQYTNTSQDMLKETYKAAAESRVKIRLALEKIAEIEKIEATEADITAEIEKMAKQYNMEPEKVRAAVPQEDLKKDLAITKAIAFVKDNAVITEKAAEKAEKKPAAKKPAAKKPAAKKTVKKAETADSADDAAEQAE